MDWGLSLRNALPDAPPATLVDIPSRFRLFDDGRVSVVYAPIDHLNLGAPIVILGITPGWQQTRLAFETAIAMRERPAAEVGAEVKRRAAFAGTMRAHLITMLDSLGVHRGLGVASTAELFGARADLVHSTSALRYPVFTAGANFTGHHPDPVKHPFLRRMLTEVLAPELASFPDALIVPLGASVERCLRLLAEKGGISEDRWLHGFPHPSGANGHRAREFAQRRSSLEAHVRAWGNTRPAVDTGATTVVPQPGVQAETTSPAAPDPSRPTSSK